MRRLRSLTLIAMMITACAAEDHSVLTAIHDSEEGDVGSVIVKAAHDTKDARQGDLVVRCIPLANGLFQLDVLVPGDRTPLTSRLYLPSGIPLDGVFEFRLGAEGTPIYRPTTVDAKLEPADGDEVEVAEYSHGRMVWSKTYQPRPNGAPPVLLREQPAPRK
jgi:hypothetical protein